MTITVAGPLDESLLTLEVQEPGCAQSLSVSAYAGWDHLVLWARRNHADTYESQLHLVSRQDALALSEGLARAVELIDEEARIAATPSVWCSDCGSEGHRYCGAPDDRSGGCACCGAPPTEDCECDYQARLSPWQRSVW